MIVIRDPCMNRDFPPQFFYVTDTLHCNLISTNKYNKERDAYNFKAFLSHEIHGRLVHNVGRHTDGYASQEAYTQQTSRVQHTYRFLRDCVVRLIGDTKGTVT